jgi:hypothetical protein
MRYLFVMSSKRANWSLTKLARSCGVPINCFRNAIIIADCKLVLDPFSTFLYDDDDFDTMTCFKALVIVDPSDGGCDRDLFLHTLSFLKF